MDTEIEELRAKMPELKMEVKRVGIQLAGLKSEIGVAELREKIERLEEAKRVKEERLRGLREGGTEVVTSEEVDRVGKEWSYWGRMRGVRMKGFKAIEGMLLEGLERDDIWERAGIEEDAY